MSTTKRLAVMAATGLLSVGIAVPTVSAWIQTDDHPKPAATTVSTVHPDHDTTTTPGPATPTVPVVTAAPMPADHTEAYDHDSTSTTGVPHKADDRGSTSTTGVPHDTTMVTHPAADDPEADDSQVHHNEAPPTTTHHDDEAHVTPTAKGHDDSENDHDTGEQHG